MESDVRMDRRTWAANNSPKSYALTGKIMLCAIVILFAVILFMAGLHIYARWYILRVRRQQLGRPRRNTHFVFYVDNASNPLTATAVENVNRGLDTSVLTSLPVFVYTSKSHPKMLECAVCLSEFEDNEKGRLLPRCNHSFHIDCIDMWFHSHSTCPLCRYNVEAEVVQAQATTNNRSSNVAVSVGEPEENEPVSSSGLCVMFQHHEENGSSASLDIQRKGSEVACLTIEVPRRNESENEFELNSFRSPGTRLLSFKRILSMNRGGGTPTPTYRGLQIIETDIECEPDELTQQGQSRAQMLR